MIKNSKLLIDKDCPMCKVYGVCFTKLGLVEKGTINPYQDIGNEIFEKVDKQKSRNEIALFNDKTNRTLYGVDALLEILFHNNLRLKALFSWTPIYYVIGILYSFVSYNRKVIYPTKATSGNRHCIPDLNIAHRSIYIILVAIITGFILNHFFVFISDYLGVSNSPIREYLICFSQVIWQGVVITFVDRSKLYEYLGNMSTVSLIGGLLLIPVILLTHFMAIPPILMIVLFGTVVSFMLFEHIRRCKLLELPLLMSFSWVLFRVLVLAVIMLTENL